MTDAAVLRNSELLYTVSYAYQHLRFKQRLYFIITQSDLRQIHSLLQSDFPRECKLVRPLSTSIIFSFPCVHLVPAYTFFLVFPSLESLL
jgi:hypothetical protein